MTSNQAVEIAVDAHATRLLQSNSPPEACVDSSLGPYVTSILREALSSRNNDITDLALSSLHEYDSLIDLLESQCQMELHVAKEVIADIARAIQTNGIPGNEDDNSNSTDCPDRRSRSKSLGAEPAQQQQQQLDVNFLGKILQETMSQQQQQQQPLFSSNELELGSNLITSLEKPLFQCTELDIDPNVTSCTSTIENGAQSHEELYPSDGMSDSFVSPMKVGFVGNGTVLLSQDKLRTERHVSFDKTHVSTFAEPQCRESWNGVEDTAGLGANLGFLDLEEDESSKNEIPEEECGTTSSSDERSTNENRGITMTNDIASFDVINTELAQCHPVSGFPDLASANSQQNNVNNIAVNDKPPINPRRTKKRSSRKEANELVAALFVINSRPRSNSLPLSVSSGTSYSFTDESVAGNKSSASLCPTETSATTNNTDHNSAVIESTTEILLTMNYHLGHEAASLASQLSYGDLNLAQYLIEAARSITTGNGFNGYHNRRRSRICRHELQGTCYRHDCPYSHDIAGVTCLFWLKGRCHHTDGSSCRFMHGFAESLLEGVNEDYLKEQQVRKEQERLYRMEEEKKNQAVFVPTTNLLQRNEWALEKKNALPTFGNGLWSSPNPLDNR